MNELLLSDAEIAQLLAEPKPLPADYRKRLHWKTKTQKEQPAHRERELAITGAAGNEFCVILR